jgi:NAD(P)-dependent dehydrogenase (short-subunit alcohol dehydrogenase family)
MNLKDKVVVVTGGGSGIGRSCALRFAKEGAKVVIADRQLKAAELVANECKGQQVLCVETDVSDPVSVEKMAQQVVTQFDRIDVLINNAGFGLTGSVTEITVEDWDRLMATNVRGVFLCSKYIIPLMAKTGGGSIVNMGSYTANAGITNRAAYVASKGAVVSLTRAMALDHVKDNIRVNAVAPGTISSPYFDKIFAESPDPEGLRQQFNARAPMNRMGSPDEIANMVVWLASDEASFATGGVFTVDGGSSTW